MEAGLQKSFIAGAERITAWADLLDSINVFPVADGDTGRNLSVSLSPLRACQHDRETVVRQLLLSARGNSGNIASRFFSAFYQIDSLQDIHRYAEDGRRRAWKAVNNPRPGTMLSVLDALAESLTPETDFRNRKTIGALISYLEKSVRQTTELLPKLKKAGVVDAGALGMYIFLEGFFYTLAGMEDACRPVSELFKDRLHISSSFSEDMENGYCVDFVLKAKKLSNNDLTEITQGQESVIVIPDGDLYKIHLHTDNREQLRAQAAKLGSMVSWEDDDLHEQIQEQAIFSSNTLLHIMTDAAGSVTRADAKKYGITVLSSYITLGEKCLPETHLHPEELYDAMRRGIKVSTAQASVFERHQFYESCLSRFEKVLYLCVGSIYTGNYGVATEWKKQHDLQNRFTVIDSGAASGRLGTMVLGTARYLAETGDAERAIAYAMRAVQLCEEYVFLDKLEYLAAGGRLSKAGAFFGDMLKMKPVISPQPEGARKVGVVRNREDQLKMALERLEAAVQKNSSPLIMLEYSDNFEWVNSTVKELVKNNCPHAEIITQPVSLTSGAHMGPGTWGIAFLPPVNL